MLNVAAPAKAMHPLDEQYNTLQADLSLLKSTSAEYKAIDKYFNATKNTGGHHKLLHVWKVARLDEDNKKRSLFCKLSNHKLLWHGTNVAVVAAILKGGLRIMPHSGAFGSKAFCSFSWNYRLDDTENYSFLSSKQTCL